MSRSVYREILNRAKALLGKELGGAFLKDEETEAYQEYLALNAPPIERLDEQRREDFSGMPVIAVMIADGEERLRRITESSIKAQTYGNARLVSDVSAGEFDFIMYMWPGDTLSPDALYELAGGAEGYDLVYCDEDRLNADGQRCEPLFKPCLDRVTQYSYDMLGRGVMASRALVCSAGAMTGCTGCDRYAYNLRLAEKSSSARHISHVLYTALDRRDIGTEGRETLERHLEGQGGLRVFPGEWRGSFRVERANAGSSASIIIYNKNACEPLMRLLGSMDAELRECRHTEIIIADGGSTDSRTLKYYDILERNRAARICRGEDSTMPELLNAAAGMANREHCLFMESCMEMCGVSWLKDMAAQSGRRSCGVVAAKLVCGGRLVHTGYTIGIRGWQDSLYRGERDDGADGQKNRLVNTIRAVSATGWVGMMTKTDLFYNVGCFDESFEETGFDTEYCIRLLRRGYDIIYAPHVVMKHTGEIKSIANGSEQDKMRSYDTIRDMLISGDPRYGSGLSYASPVPQIAVSPEPPAMMNDMFRAR